MIRTPIIHSFVNKRTHMSTQEREHKPHIVITIGMAGSGKTTFMQRVNSFVHEKNVRAWMVNLDPAATHVPYGCNIDIRDTIDYKETMKNMKLGPNGAILTCLNLFTTRFDQVLDIIAQHEHELDYVFIDTPGQIECFTWSASGKIITDALAATYPTSVVYMIDAERASNPRTFVTSMLYGCSLLYRFNVPLTLCFNKSDVVDPSYCESWLADYYNIQLALENDPSFMASFSTSLALVLEEFWQGLTPLYFSALTGRGCEDLFERLSEAENKYYDEILPRLNAKIAEKHEKMLEEKKDDIEQLRQDLEEDLHLGEDLKDEE